MEKMKMWAHPAMKYGVNTYILILKHKIGLKSFVLFVLHENKCIAVSRSMCRVRVSRLDEQFIMIICKVKIHNFSWQKQRQLLISIEIDRKQWGIANVHVFGAIFSRKSAECE